MAEKEKQSEMNFLRERFCDVLSLVRINGFGRVSIFISTITRWRQPVTLLELLVKDSAGENRSNRELNVSDDPKTVLEMLQ